MVWNLTGTGTPPQIMFQQLRPGNSYAKISWQDLFAAMRVYCERYSLGPEQQVTLHITFEDGYQEMPPALTLRQSTNRAFSSCPTLCSCCSPAT